MSVREKVCLAAAVVAAAIFIAFPASVTIWIDWPAQRHSASAHGACDVDATQTAQNASAAVGPHGAPMRGNGDFGEE